MSPLLPLPHTPPAARRVLCGRAPHHRRPDDSEAREGLEELVEGERDVPAASGRVMGFGQEETPIELVAGV